MSRPELDGWLAALAKLNGSKTDKRKNGAATSTKTMTFKSLRKKRKKGNVRGRKL